MGSRRPTDAALLLCLVLLLTGFSSPVRAETCDADYRSPADRALAATWLGRLRSRAAVDALIRLCGDPDGAVRVSAVEALGEIGDRRAYETLALLAADETQGRVEGMERFDGRFTRYTGPVWASGLYDIRNAAIQAMDRITGAGGPPGHGEAPEGVPPEPDPVDFVDAEAIPDARRAEAIRALLPEIAKAEPDWRTFKAAYQLGRLRAKEAVPDLLRLLAHGEVTGYGSYRGAASGYQSMAAWALVEIADPASVPAVRRLALDPERPPIVRSTALVAWARLDGAGALEDVLRIFREPREPPGWSPWPFVTWPRALRVRSRGPADAFPWFQDLHQAAAWALGDIGGDAAEEAFVEHLFRSDAVPLDCPWAVHRVVPEALEEWSARRTSRKNAALRASAVSIRYIYFPEESADLVLGILEGADDPLLPGTLTFLRTFSLADARVSRALRRRLAGAVPPATCNDRLELIDALGRQGDEVAEVALIEFAATGGVGSR